MPACLPRAAARLPGLSLGAALVTMKRTHASLTAQHTHQASRCPSEADAQDRGTSTDWRMYGRAAHLARTAAIAALTVSEDLLASMGEYMPLAA